MKRFFAQALLTVACAGLLPAIAYGLTDDEIRAQIAELLSQLTSIQTQLQAGQSTSIQATAAPVAQPSPTPSQVGLPACPALAHSFGRGVQGSEVAALQRFLAAFGLLSSDSVTGYFGALTEKALQEWQMRQDIVTQGSAATTGFGYLGARTRAAIAANCSGSASAVAGATLRATQSGTDPKTIIVDATVNTANSCGGTYLVQYGDGGSDRIQLPNTVCNSFTQRFPHTYKVAGAYTISITSGVLRVEVPVNIAINGSTSCAAPVFTIPTISAAVPNYSFTLPVITYLGDALNPVTISASGLPQSLKLTDQTSLATSTAQTIHAWSITGIAPSLGNYTITLSASNNCGSATATLVIPVILPSATQSAICPSYTYPTCPTAYHIDYRPSGNNNCSAIPICVADPVTITCPHINVDCAMGYTYSGDVTDSNGCKVRGQCVPTVATACVPAAPPASLGLDPFYKKYCSVKGIPVLSSAAVPDSALRAAATIMDKMLSPRTDIVPQLLAHSLKVGIMGANEVTTSLPEYKNLNAQFPGTDWNTRTRGIGATVSIPLSSGAEENLLCYASDHYHGESIFLHEFSHTMATLGVEFLDSTFHQKLQSAYSAAITKGLWANTYAATNLDEYWAEGVQDYFDANASADPSNGIHNTIHTRTQLQTYDPTLYALIAGMFPTDWRWSCPS